MFDIKKPYVVVGPGGIEMNSYATIEEANAELQRILSGDPDMDEEAMQTIYEVTLTKKDIKIPKEDKGRWVKVIEPEEKPDEDVVSQLPWEA
jgi:hypothetical protein